MRSRDTKRWGIGRLYPDMDDFLDAPLTDGLHTIQFGNSLLDLGTFDRKSPVTVVTFHAKVTENTRVPAAVGVGFTKKIGANLVALADPGISVGNDVEIGWWEGTRKMGNLEEILVPIIRHCLDSFQSERTILWGSSAGGYGAVKYARHFPGSLVFTINPVVSLTPYWDKLVASYITTAREAQGRTPFQRIRNSMTTDLSSLYLDGLPGYFAMYQNTGDHEYLPEQHAPFVEKLKHDPKLYQRFEYDGEFHVPIPEETHIQILSNLVNMDVDIPSAITNAGFVRP